MKRLFSYLLLEKIPLAGWQKIIFGLFLVSVTLLCFIPMRFQVGHLHIGHLYDGLHFPAGFGLGLLIGLLSSPNKISSLWVSRYLLLFFVIAILLELLQPLTGRSATPQDGFIGFIGMGFGFMTAICYQLRKRFTFILTLFLSILLTVLFNLDISLQLYSRPYRDKAFPIIGDFEIPLIEQHLWQPIITRDRQKIIQKSILLFTKKWATRGQKSLLITGKQGVKTGVSFSAEGQNWMAYAYLKADFYLSSSSVPNTLMMNVEIRDKNHRISRLSQSVKTGYSELSISLEHLKDLPREEFDLSEITSMTISLINPDAPISYALDFIRLEEE